MADDTRASVRRWSVALRDSGIELFAAPTWHEALCRAQETLYLSGTPVRITAVTGPSVQGDDQ